MNGRERPADDWETQALVSGRAWAHLCDGLRDVGQQIIGADFPQMPDARAEGFAHLAHLVEEALSWYVDYADPDNPRFCTMNDTAEVADNHFAAVRPGCSYRIVGNVATLEDLNISLHDGFVFRGRRQVWGDLGKNDLDIDVDGNLELVISETEHPGNWLRLPDGAEIVQIREYFADWECQSPGSFVIERIDRREALPPWPAPTRLAQAFDDTVGFVNDYLDSHRSMIERLYPQTANTMTEPSGNSAGNRNITYAMGRFSLGDDEALILEFPEPEARLWTVQWLTTPWYSNPDMVNRQTSIVGRHAHVDEDGVVRIALAPRDPGAPNWLDTAGHSEGVVVSRYIWGTGSALSTRVVPLNAVRGQLPPDTPLPTPAQREVELSRRRSHLARRGRIPG